MSKSYVYYMTQRPPMPGAMPAYGLVGVEEYDGRKEITQSGVRAWAKLTYSRELKNSEVVDYELTPSIYHVDLTRREILYLIDMLKKDIHTDESAETIYMTLMDVLDMARKG